MTQTLADRVEVDLPRLRHEPLPRELRVLYLKEGESARREAARRGLWVGVAVYLIFSVTDILLIPDVAAYTIAARFAVSAVSLLILHILYDMNAGTEWLERTCAGALASAYIGWLIPTVTSSLTESCSYYMIFGAIFMMSANLFFRFQFSLSLLTSGVMLAAFFISLYFFPATVPYQLAFGTFYISTFAFTSYVNWNLNEERYNVFLNALEAKIQQNEATERGHALLRLSRTDPLTGLENRRAVDEKLRDFWSDWQKFGNSFAAILVDVDFFKRFNDCYGGQQKRGRASRT